MLSAAVSGSRGNIHKLDFPVRDKIEQFFCVFKVIFHHIFAVVFHGMRAGSFVENHVNLFMIEQPIEDRIAKSKFTI